MLCEEATDVVNWYDLSKYLDRHTVTSSAPCRVDCGGSTDHRLTGLLCKQWHPTTTNIALELRSTVCLESYTPGIIVAESDGFGQQEATIPDVALSGPLGLVLAFATHFGVHGVRIVIKSQSPPRSGLGGSGAVSVAIIGALSAALPLLSNQQYELPEIALLAHNIEDSLYGNTGLQDQAAAVYGGVHLWEWRYGSSLDFVRHSLSVDPTTLERHIVLAYTGRPHPLSHRGSPVLDSVRHSHGGALDILTEISQTARDFAEAIQTGSYRQAGQALLAELGLRLRLMPEVLAPEHRILVEIARDWGCGAKTTGYGGGGCIWAIGPEECISKVQQQWKRILCQHNVGYLLPVSIARSGLQVRVDERSCNRNWK